MTFWAVVAGAWITGIIIWICEHICFHRYSVIDSHRESIYIVTTYECMWCGKKKVKWKY